MVITIAASHGLIRERTHSSWLAPYYLRVKVRHPRRPGSERANLPRPGPGPTPRTNPLAASLRAGDWPWPPPRTLACNLHCTTWTGERRGMQRGMHSHPGRATSASRPRSEAGRGDDIIVVYNARADAHTPGHEAEAKRFASAWLDMRLVRAPAPPPSSPASMVLRVEPLGAILTCGPAEMRS